jgi:hypothetical protein
MASSVGSTQCPSSAATANERIVASFSLAKACPIQPNDAEVPATPSMITLSLGEEM